MEALQRAATSSNDLLIVRKAASQPSPRVQTDHPTRHSECHQGTLAPAESSVEDWSISRPGSQSNHKNDTKLVVITDEAQTVLKTLTVNILFTGCTARWNKHSSVSSALEQSESAPKPPKKSGSNHLICHRQTDGSGTIPTGRHPELGIAAPQRLARVDQDDPWRWEQSKREQSILRYECRRERAHVNLAIVLLLANPAV